MARWARIGPDGQLLQPLSIGEGPIRGLSWSSGGSRTALLYSTKDGVQLALLDEAGAALSAPIRADVGNPGGLPVAAGIGETFFVAWETAARRGAITALDASGRLAPPTPIADGGEITSPAIVAAADGVLVVYGAGSVNAGTLPRAERFVCRKQPPLGPPPALPKR